MMKDVMVCLIMATAMISVTTVAFVIPPPTTTTSSLSFSSTQFSFITTTTTTTSASKTDNVDGDSPTSEMTTTTKTSSDIARLEKSIGLLNKFLQRGKERPIKQKRFRFSTSVSASTTVKEAKEEEEEDASLTLDKYMTLPIDEYNLLDERFFSRTKDGFQMSLPFGDIIEDAKGEKIVNGLSLSGISAQCNLGVQSDPTKRKNTITASSCKIVVDKEKMEEAAAKSASDKEQILKIKEKWRKTANFTSSENPFDKPLLKSEINTTEQGVNNLSASFAQLEAQHDEGMEQMMDTLTTEERAELNRSIYRALDVAALEVDAAVILSWGDSGGRFKDFFSIADSTTTTTAGDNILRPINAKFTLDAEVTLSLPFPRFILNPLGSVILRFIFGPFLSRSLQALGRDYERRAGTDTVIVIDNSTEAAD